ncbi:sulfurtransferase complex subunit TusB [Kushneria marisflavi]|uniref:Uncharacterized protein n=1 Tax=Kushneria marisflavi TaxID=157779 RepID=A0A240UJN0_9GAMM|nr:sulfurtransferase complex subunit TusB [Kushneria marisflavi]ART61704.1 hypothetical protein B9H00_00360 [Kushneria marisflavi]RKD86722.1 tRNA 2-thiouridine synthesizing protein B [Kushneria marisflavi]
MSTLHLVNRSPFATRILDELAAAVCEGDHVLLIEDGVYAANGTALDDFPGGVELWVLEEDCISRGVAPSDASRRVSMAGFVDLTATTHRTVSWF